MAKLWASVLKTGQLPFSILNLGKTRVSVFPEVEESVKELLTEGRLVMISREKSETCIHQSVYSGLKEKVAADVRNSF